MTEENAGTGPTLPKPDHLYVIGAGDGVVKIGRSANPASRLSSIQTGNPKKMMILHVVPGAGDLEPQVHQAFSGCRLGGEWFDFCEGDPVAEVCSAIEKIQEVNAKAEAALAQAAAERAAASPITPVRYPERNYKPMPRRDACAPYDCSHFATLNVAFALAGRFAETHPEAAAAFLADEGHAWHCVESAFPGLTQQEAN